MFDVFGDEINYDRVPIATFLPNVRPTVRDYAEGLLYTADPDAISGADHEKECGELRYEAAAVAADYEDKIADLERENAALEKLVDAIDGGATLLEVMADRDDALDAARKWRCAYEDMERQLKHLKKYRARRAAMEGE